MLLGWMFDIVLFVVYGSWGQFCKTFYDRNLQIFVISLSVCPKLFQPSLIFAGEAGAYL